MTIAEMIRKRRAWAQWRQASKPIGGREIDDIRNKHRQWLVSKGADPESVRRGKGVRIL
jgi:hypothetical protein